MKKLSLFLIIFLISITGLAQQASVDVIYLKNGTVIRGKILENIPNQRVKVYTTNRSIVELKTEEIERMTKEEGSKEFLLSSSESLNQQGDFVAGGGVSLFSKSSALGDSSFSQKSSKMYIRVNTMFDYFIFDNLAIGANASLDMSLAGGNITFWLGPEIKYYFDFGLILKFETDLVSLGNNLQGNKAIFRPGIGYAFSLNQNLSFDAGLFYEIYSKGTYDTGALGGIFYKDKLRSIGVQAGLSFFF